MSEPTDLDDFLTLVDRYEGRVRLAVTRFLDDSRDVEEAVQDTFVQAWRHKDRFRGESATFTWLYRIATNTALMRLRGRGTPGPLAELDGRPHVQAHDPLGDHAERLVRIGEVRVALANLPDQHRVVVMLRDVEGYSNAEVADLLGLPVTTTKAYLHRGRKALRRALHP